jgi:hypothetical protein
MSNEELKLALKKDWDYFPHYEKPQGHFVGRIEEKNKLENWFLRREKGCLLVSGERGVGKTALVYEALYKTSQKDKRIIPVLINASQLIIEESLSENKEVLEISAEKLEEKIIVNLIRRLYTASRSKLQGDLKERLGKLYQKAICGKSEIRQEIKLEKESKQEAEGQQEIKGTCSVDMDKVQNFLSSLGIVLGMFFFMSATKGNTLLNVALGSLAFLLPKELSYKFFKKVTNIRAIKAKNTIEELYITDKSISNLEYDLYAFLDEISSSKDNFKIIFIIDEMDKIKDTERVKITDIIKTFKNLFTLSSGLFVFIAGKEIYDTVEKSKEQREIAYTFFNDKIFITRPNFEDLEKYIDEIIDEPKEKFIDDKIYHDFRNLLCYQSKSDFFELHFRLRDYIKGYDQEDRPLLSVVALDTVEKFHANMQKALGQIYGPNKYLAPSCWYQNNLLLSELYKFIDIPWFQEISLSKDSPTKEDSLPLRTWQAQKNLIEYLLRLGIVSAKGDIMKTIDGKNIPFNIYTWTQSVVDIPSNLQELLDYEKSFLYNLELFSTSINEINEVRIFLKDNKIKDAYDKTKIYDNEILTYCDIDALSIYQGNQKYVAKLKDDIPQHISREELDNQSKKITAYKEQLKNQVVTTIERLFKNHVELVNFVFTNFGSDASLFGSTMTTIREGVLNNKLPHLCFYRKIPKYSRQILVVKDISEKLYEDNKDLINENAGNHLIINLNTSGAKYNLEYVQRHNRRERKIRGFVDIPVYESFSQLLKVFEEVKKRDKELISESEKEGFLKQPINRDTLRAYTEWKFPDKPISEEINSRIPSDLDSSKYPTLKGIDEVIEKAKPAVEAYFKDNPNIFEFGTDFVTKSLGFIDDAFLAKHPFSQETKDAAKKYKRLIEG